MTEHKIVISLVTFSTGRRSNILTILSTNNVEAGHEKYFCLSSCHKITAMETGRVTAVDSSRESKDLMVGYHDEQSVESLVNESVDVGWTAMPSRRPFNIENV